jgi:hypothetical protein
MRTMEAMTATPPIMKIPRSAQRFFGASSSFQKALNGRMKIAKSVRMLIPANAKYVLRRLIQPFGKEGD